MLQQLGRSPLNFLALLQGARALQGQPMMADAGDEAFLRRYQEQGFEGQPFNQPAVQQVMPDTAITDPVTTPQRGRVNPLNVLGRVLAPRTFEALDTERTRLQAEAMRPQNNARINAVLSRIEDPREAALFLGLGGEDWQKNVGQQYAPQIGSPGSVQFIAGRAVAGAPQQYDSGNDRRSFNPATGVDSYVGTRGPTYAESNAAERNRIDAIGAGQNTVGRYRIDANGSVVFESPDDFTLNQGDTRYSNGQQVAQADRAPRPVPDAVRRDNERDEQQISDRASTIARIDNAIGLIDQGMINLDPASRASAWIRNNTGNSSPQSAAQAELRRTVETLRNQILNDATGPQTDGDSLRALNQVLSGWGDEAVVRAGLSAYRDIQARKTATQQAIMNNRMAQYGDTSAGYGGAMSGGQGGGGQITPEQARAILRQRGVQGY